MQDIKSIIAKHKALDGMFAVIGLLALMVGLVTLLALIIDLAMDGVPRLAWTFFTSFPSRFPEQAGILAAWVGTTLVDDRNRCHCGDTRRGRRFLLLEEYAPKNWTTALIEINIANLAAVPSIVYGPMALGLSVYQFGLGQSILTAGLTLALLVLPMVIIATREAVRAIPSSIREAAYALGATKWQMVWSHVLPYSTGGILTGSDHRAVARHRRVRPAHHHRRAQLHRLPAGGAGQRRGAVRVVPVAVDPFTVMPIQMFNWVSRPQEAFHINAAAAGLVLLGMTLVMNWLAISIRYRFRKRIKW